jgi:ligand-binding sensor domain-containing protein
LALCGDTLWVGSDSGLFVMQPATPSNPMRAYSSGSDPVLDARIVALVAHDSVLAVASEKSVELVNRRTGRIIARPAAADYSTLGGISSIALDERALWVGGRNGVMMLIRDSRTVRSLRAPSQIPGPVTALALSLNAGWIGTPDGLVRMRRAADGGAP